ncbi:hypothetical protein FACS189472_04700 [Alphaproteobacteria bacterium]|nr:hypothetical protein FACS189472_04700 [Alphaproteobacteria bacterium]
MIKRIAYILLVLSQISAFSCYGLGDRKDTGGKIVKCTLKNGIEVALYCDFKMEEVVVCIVFHVGRIDAPIDKGAITDVICDNIVNTKLHRQFQDLGIRYEICSSDFSTRIVAHMHPENLDKFFSVLSKSLDGIVVENLEMYKKQWISEYKLRSYCCDDTVDNHIRANVKFSDESTLPVFSEQSIDSITESDVKLFYKNNFINCPLTIIVSGAVGHKSLRKMLRDSFSDLPPRKARTYREPQKIEYRDILIENQYMGTSIRYGYVLSAEENSKFGETFDHMLSHEMQKFFCGVYPLCDFCISTPAGNGGCLKLITLYPKYDISLKTLANSYGAFVRKMSTMEITPDSIKKIAERESMDNSFVFANLGTMYNVILDAFINGMDVNHIYSIANDIIAVNTKEFRAFVEKMFRQNPIFRITTKFKRDS